MSHKSQSTWQIFIWPAVLALLAVLGLFAALLGDGWWDALSCFGLGIPAWLSVRGMNSR
ncbi:hypothetical protein ACI2KG_25520 [Pseudomonas sp. NPDC089407]|uniref:hypothetical protein n=1 Tax=Pseudomonas sp. NPDC089407 TaxID=3364464 RepID=UPI00384CA251